MKVALQKVYSTNKTKQYLTIRIYRINQGNQLVYLYGLNLQITNKDNQIKNHLKKLK